MQEILYLNKRDIKDGSLRYREYARAAVQIETFQGNVVLIPSFRFLNTQFNIPVDTKWDLNKLFELYYYIKVPQRR